MTISSTTRVAGPFIGAGTTATFPFSFKVFEATDLSVTTLATATGVIATLALTTDYTVALNADQDTSPGGSITLTAGNLATGFTLVITTGIPNLQGLDLTNGGAFYPDTINAALDLLTILVQQLQAQVARCIQFPISDDLSLISPVLAPAAFRAGKYLSFDVNGQPVAQVGVTVGGAVSVAISSVIATVGQTLFVTPVYVLGSNKLTVFQNGLRLTDVTDYNETDTGHITLTNGATAGDAYLFVVLQ